MSYVSSSSASAGSASASSSVDTGSTTFLPAAAMAGSGDTYGAGDEQGSGSEGSARNMETWATSFAISFLLMMDQNFMQMMSTGYSFELKIFNDEDSFRMISIF